MILNTRNFLLYLLAVAFLVIAIATTATSRSAGELSSPSDYVPTPTEISNEAAVIGAIALDRADRLSTLKEKVAVLIDTATTDSVTSEAEPPPAEEVQLAVETDTVSRGGEQRCDTYKPFVSPWQANGLTFNVVEGARLLSRTTPAGEETVLQLPLRSFPLAAQSCLPTDVVAVALDGSLIRNDEVSLYTLFTDETLLGYTIDGFPLYGVTERPVDDCGGTIVDGQYHYYLNSESPHILSCYVGIPVDL